MKNKNYDFSNSYTNINQYVEQNSPDFISTVVGKIRTMDWVTPILDVKTSKVIPLVNSMPDFVSSDTCSTFANGATTSFVGITLSTKELKLEESFCLRDLELYYPTWFQRGSDKQDLPLENAFMEEKMGKIAKKIDTIYWQNGSGVTGVLATATASGCQILATQSFAVSTSYSNGIIATFDNMCDLLDSDYRSQDDLVIYCGTDTFDKYTRSIRNVESYHYSSDEIDNGVVKLYGKRNVTVMSTIGLDGTNKAYLHKKEYVYFPTDIAPESEPIVSHYDFVLDKYLIRYKFKIGVSIAEPTKSILAKA